MEPASIFAVVEGAGGLALKCVSLVKTLNDVASKYKQAKLTVLSMVQHVEIVQLAWERIDQWSQEYLRDGVEAHCEEDEKLLQRLRTSLDVGTLVMEALEEDLLPFRRQLDKLGLRGKTRIVWSESALNAHQDRLSHQVQAMTCLLQTINIVGPKTRRDFLEVTEPILFKSDESAYSIVPSRISSKLSLSTTNTGSASLQYHPLAFEDALFTAKVYKRNYRNGLIDQLFKARTDRARRRATSEDQNDDTRSATMALDPLHPLESLMSHPSTSVDLVFMNACQENAIDTLEDLVSSGPKTDSQKVSFDIFRWGLAEAFVSDRLAVAQILLHIRSEDYMSQLTEDDRRFLTERACVKKDSPFFELLLQHAVKRVDPAAQFYLDGLLLKAATISSRRLIVRLIEAGANVNCADEQGVRPLHLVSLHPKIKKNIRILLDYGAGIDAQDNEGMTPLISACSHQRWSNAQYLIACGANFKLTDNTGEQAIDKLPDTFVSTTLIFVVDLKRHLRVLQDANIYKLDTWVHHHLQTAALQHDNEPLKAALWFAEGHIVSLLRSFVRERFRNSRTVRRLHFDGIAMLMDLISKAENLQKWSHMMVKDNETSWFMIHKILCLLFNFIYQITYSPFHPSPVFRDSQYQSFREALSIPILICEPQSMSGTEVQDALVAWCSSIERAQCSSIQRTLTE